MKIILWVLAVISAVILCNGIYQFVRDSGSRMVVFSPGKLQGMEPQGGSELQELKTAYVTKISQYNANADKAHDNWMWLNFAVTVLTAGSTLVSSISAAKTKQPDNSVAGKAVIWIAVITFFASIGNWSAGQVNEKHSTWVQKVSTVVEQRNKFYSEYDKTPGCKQIGAYQQVQGRSCAYLSSLL